jgi:hypothetical protein
MQPNSSNDVFRAGLALHRASHSEAIIEHNEVHGNSTAANRGVSVRDARDPIVRENRFGTAQISGDSYQGNARSKAIVAGDSGRADRPALANVEIVGNLLRGETQLAHIKITRKKFIFSTAVFMLLLAKPAVAQVTTCPTGLTVDQAKGFIVSQLGACTVSAVR